VIRKRCHTVPHGLAPFGNKGQERLGCGFMRSSQFSALFAQGFTKADGFDIRRVPNTTPRTGVHFTITG
jgi:hypothetical protein